MSRLLDPGNVVSHRLAVLSRVLAASLGGYAVTALISAVLALALPLLSGASRADAVMIATMLSFAVYAIVAIWVFCARTALRAWVGLIGVALPAGLIVLALRMAS